MIESAKTSDRYFELCKEISRHMEDVELNKSAHFNKSSRIRKKIDITNKIVYISLWGLVILWFTSTQLNTLLIAFGYDYNDSTKYILESLLPVILVIFGLFGTTLQYFGGYQEMERGHWRAAMRYQRIFRKIKNWKTDCPSADFVDGYFKEIGLIRQEITEANEDSPDLNEVDWATAKINIETGSSSYAIDS